MTILTPAMVEALGRLDPVEWRTPKELHVSYATLGALAKLELIYTRIRTAGSLGVAECRLTDMGQRMRDRRLA